MADFDKPKPPGRRNRQKTKPAPKKDAVDDASPLFADATDDFGEDTEELPVSNAVLRAREHLEASKAAADAAIRRSAEERARLETSEDSSDNLLLGRVDDALRESSKPSEGLGLGSMVDPSLLSSDLGDSSPVRKPKDDDLEEDVVESRDWRVSVRKAKEQELKEVLMSSTEGNEEMMRTFVSLSTSMRRGELSPESYCDSVIDLVGTDHARRLLELAADAVPDITRADALRDELTKRRRAEAARIALERMSGGKSSGSGAPSQRIPSSGSGAPPQKKPSVPSSGSGAPPQKKPTVPSSGGGAPPQKKPTVPSSGGGAPPQKKPTVPSSAAVAPPPQSIPSSGGGAPPPQSTPPPQNSSSASGGGMRRGVAQVPLGPEGSDAVPAESGGGWDVMGLVSGVTTAALGLVGGGGAAPEPRGSGDTYASPPDLPPAIVMYAHGLLECKLWGAQAAEDARGPYVEYVLQMRWRCPAPPMERRVAMSVDEINGSAGGVLIPIDAPPEDGGRQWDVSWLAARRYSEFESLHEVLQTRAARAPEIRRGHRTGVFGDALLPSLPGRSIFVKGTDAGVVAQRLSALGTFLRTLFRSWPSLLASSELDEFLGLTARLSGPMSEIRIHQRSNHAPPSASESAYPSGAAPPLSESSRPKMHPNARVQKLSEQAEAAARAKGPLSIPELHLAIGAIAELKRVVNGWEPRARDPRRNAMLQGMALHVRKLATRIQTTVEAATCDTPEDREFPPLDRLVQAADDADTAIEALASLEAVANEVWGAI